MIFSTINWLLRPTNVSGGDGAAVAEFIEDGFYIAVGLEGDGAYRHERSYGLASINDLCRGIRGYFQCKFDRFLNQPTSMRCRPPHRSYCNTRSFHQRCCLWSQSKLPSFAHH